MMYRSPVKTVLRKFSVLLGKCFFIISRSKYVPRTSAWKTFLWFSCSQSFNVKVCTSYLKIPSQELAYHIKFTGQSCLHSLMVSSTKNWLVQVDSSIWKTSAVWLLYLRLFLRDYIPSSSPAWAACQPD